MQAHVGLGTRLFVLHVLHLCALVHVVHSTAATCPSDVKGEEFTVTHTDGSVERKCLFVSSYSMPFTQCQFEACGRHNATLVCVRSWEENEFVIDFMKENQVITGWLGYHEGRGKGQWAWTSQCNSNFEQWKHEEPNDFCGKEDCTLVSPSIFGNEWVDVSCASTNAYCLCETNTKLSPTYEHEAEALKDSIVDYSKCDEAKDGIQMAADVLIDLQYVAADWGAAERPLPGPEGAAMGARSVEPEAASTAPEEREALFRSDYAFLASMYSTGVVVRGNTAEVKRDLHFLRGSVYAVLVLGSIGVLLNCAILAVVLVMCCRLFDRKARAARDIVSNVHSAAAAGGAPTPFPLHHSDFNALDEL